MPLGPRCAQLDPHKISRRLFWHLAGLGQPRATRLTHEPIVYVALSHIQDQICRRRKGVGSLIGRSSIRPYLFVQGVFALHHLISLFVRCLMAGYLQRANVVIESGMDKLVKASSGPLDQAHPPADMILLPPSQSLHELTLKVCPPVKNRLNTLNTLRYSWAAFRRKHSSSFSRFSVQLIYRYESLIITVHQKQC